jgi:hypothetical protein
MKRNTSRKSAAAGREQKNWLEWEDGMLNHCRALLTLAGLLAQSGEDGMLAAELVNETGALIAREVKELKQRLHSRPGRRVAR